MQQWLTGYKLKNRPYEILQILGEGGFGITYKAKSLALDIPVVIKTPNSRLQRDKNYSKYLANFTKEAKQLAKLGMNPHPNIVRVFDFFEEDGLPCIVMDYIPGNSLYDIVQMNGALPEKQALRYIKQIGSALLVCHQQGIIHRDAHPNNILIHADSGKAILIDFGISGSTQTSRSNRSGNQAFAPWEQLISFGEESSKTPQVDIYTLAASFYYLVTGDTPTPSLARKFNNDELNEPKQYNSQMSDRINEAILKGMTIEPSDRPQTIMQWLKLLAVIRAKTTGENKVIANTKITKIIQDPKKINSTADLEEKHSFERGKIKSVDKKVSIIEKLQQYKISLLLIAFSSIVGLFYFFLIENKTNSLNSDLSSESTENNNKSSELSDKKISKVNYRCDDTSVVPVTVASKDVGETRVLIRWTEERYYSSGKSYDIVCREVSIKLQNYYELGKLKYLTTSIINNLNVICVAKELGSSCLQEDILYTLQPNIDPNQELMRLLDFKN